MVRFRYKFHKLGMWNFEVVHTDKSCATITGGSKEAMAPKHLTKFCFAKKTGFMSNWLTRQVVITQKVFSFREASLLTP